MVDMQDSMEGTITELKDLRPQYLFVYGTLRRGCGNNRVMPRDAKFQAEVRTRPGYALYDSGLPCMVKDAPAHSVLGELYEISRESLRMLDRFEGHPTFYRREAIEVEGWISPVWAYLRADGGDKHGELVASGDWKSKG
jgi:gamma-glutamylaminecyclotransferase